MNIKKRKTELQRKTLVFKIIVGLLAITLFFIITYIIGRSVEQNSHVQGRGEMSEDFNLAETLEYEGQTYIRKPNQTNILIMGIDKNNKMQTQNFRKGGQADFLLLLVIDNKDKTIHQLQIDRDTITEVAVLGVLGKPVGTSTMQICLAHGFGENSKENCEYTTEAVKNFLQGIKISLYVAADLNAIDAFNDALDGVVVTLEEDFSAFDPQMAKGKTLQLTNEQAEYFVRSRINLGDESNQSRMKRQRTYLTSAITTLLKKTKENTMFLSGFYDTMEKTVVTNISKGRMINELNKIQQYTISPIKTLEGEHKIGRDGFMEFHVEEESVTRWVLETFYELKATP